MESTEMQNKIILTKPIEVQSLEHRISNLAGEIKWSWACRILEDADYNIDALVIKPKPGDLVVVKVESNGYHNSIMTVNNKKLRIYVGDLLVGVFGNRYAADAFEGEVNGLEDLSILTAGGMIGTLKSRHQEIKKPTNVSFLGFLTDERHQKINLKELKFHISQPKGKIKNLILAVGTGMNSGKTTSSSKLIRGLSTSGFKVAACKLTGSVSNRDQDEMRSASAKSVIDFSDYGFPSTYLCTRKELIDLFGTMLSDAENSDPDVIVMEIADGLLQRETAMLLADPLIKNNVKGVLLAAESATSALYGIDKLKNLGYSIIAVSGAITSSPLYVREFKENSPVPVIPSTGEAEELVETVKDFIKSKG
ncbi:MAG TPA: hypothetical protein VLD38_01430 [Nitrosopumilaceae archaeon]|nr:hypothetical protein [Nitrosopumilaceae archaeon]